MQDFLFDTIMDTVKNNDIKFNNIHISTSNNKALQISENGKVYIALRHLYIDLFLVYFLHTQEHYDLIILMIPRKKLLASFKQSKKNWSITLEPCNVPAWRQK